MRSVRNGVSAPSTPLRGRLKGLRHTHILGKGASKEIRWQRLGRAGKIRREPVGHGRVAKDLFTPSDGPLQFSQRNLSNNPESTRSSCSCPFWLVTIVGLK